MRPSIPASALVASIVGFGGTLALVLAAADALGATPAQATSWITAICLAKAAETLWLSWRYRMPVITAWSTPGAALIAASTGFTMADGVGAFIVASLLLIATGLFRPLGRLIARIPAHVASGMLAGILVSFVTGAFAAIGTDPLLVLPLMVLFFAARLFSPAFAVILVLVGGAALALVLGRVGELAPVELSRLVVIVPEFGLPAVIGIAIPLYLVTMASQNLSGLAVLRAAGYEPPAGPLIAVTGLGSLLSAPFGAHPTNLAAISAAICTSADTHPDPAQRWLTGPFYALAYVVFAAFGASLVALFAALPPQLVILIAGLGLIAPLINALTLALDRDEGRMAAIVAFAVTASGIAVAGIGAAFWGLVAGMCVHWLQHARDGFHAGKS